MSEIEKSERNKVEEKEFEKETLASEPSEQIEHKKKDNIENKLEELNKMEKYLEKIKVEEDKEEKIEISEIEPPISNLALKPIPVAADPIEKKEITDSIQGSVVKDKQIDKVKHSVEAEQKENIKILPRSIIEEINKHTSNQNTQERPIRIIPIGTQPQQQPTPQQQQQPQANPLNQQSQERPIRIIPIGTQPQQQTTPQQQQPQTNPLNQHPQERPIRIIPIGTQPQQQITPEQQPTPQSQQRPQANLLNQQSQERPIRIIPIGTQPQQQIVSQQQPTPQSQQKPTPQSQQQPSQQQTNQRGKDNQRYTQNVIVNEEEDQWEKTKKDLKEKWQKTKVEIKKKYKEVEQKIKAELGMEQKLEQTENSQLQKPIMKISIPNNFSGYSCHFCNQILNPELVERVFKGIPTVCEYCGIDLESKELLK